MSLKQEIETWVAALASYDNNEFDVALKVFDQISDTSKILFNCGVIHATLGEHEKAVDCYQRAVRLDQYLAVAYFQQGVSNFLMGDFEEALANFNDTLLYLRGNNNIDYEQLGLKFKLYSCEVLFNRGLCYIYLQQREAGLQDLSFAAKEKVVPDHDVIDEAIREEADGYTVFSIPVGIVYRPNEAKVKNLKTKDYLGKARLVAASDRANAFTGFAGAEMKKGGQAATDDRTEDKISYAATNLVKPELQSRARQQSEPPMNRNMFPPTPPPETDRRGGERGSGGRAADAAPSNAPMSRAQSVRGGGPKPQPLNLGRAAFDPPRDEPPRRQPTQRSASERPPPTRSESQRDRGDRSDRSQRGSQRERERSRRRGSDEDILDDYYENDPYPPSRGSRGANTRSKQARRPAYIEEEEEDDYDGSDLDDAEFEMMSRSKSSRRRSPARSTRSGGSTRGGGGGGGMKVRVKVHSNDTRYVFISGDQLITEFWQQIREKFGVRNKFKVEFKDDGDMITMADQDDLDMAIQAAKSIAKREGSDMAKMEVWVREV
ncbi:NADPH oxidase regulator [Pyrenophora tritici-repentis]|uniref:NADPH oxidase regulator n=3 Tax=Pyrenophora tritici-repentis TaxID=45151 RepID=A0A2W1F2C6_9PLEO|nr:NADPH oxidase regulator NoxR [Pyrenophora tritici-repentis Pt-1C-BFP]KAF7443513.1 NADPH oxidase regulator [Pyrenophora tritici-repentis]EDU51096.1 NADPH oxidase regulator NoxR [Pyrenophora tritici-repentis Pt-1C-BFP]KAG9379252.1 NADPH oxidase regulator [Pyrenophora tritici-repentis]KAI0578514.1 NADPH oxidase regulator [Pyrenophora tritici-repentis]KAI0579373.1 NADPH oxidase regulator [Pyrenophora tritici-repentis]